MARFFNTAGVCAARKHYMLPPERRLPTVGSLIDQEAYFVVHAPRQSGRTTCFHHLAREPEIADPVVREILGTSSPFNVKVESLTLDNFTRAEVAELYGQHTHETGQVFAADAVDLAYGLTRGRPWLVNALARQAVTQEAPDPAKEVTVEHVERAKEALILRRDTHLDSLANRFAERGSRGSRTVDGREIPVLRL